MGPESYPEDLKSKQDQFEFFVESGIDPLDLIAPTKCGNDGLALQQQKSRQAALSIRPPL